MSSEPTATARPAATLPWRLARLALGVVFLGLSLGAAAMLVVQHLGHLELPGCGPESGCAALADGRWGSLLGWPVSYLGTAYFSALVVAWLWIGGRGGISGWFQWGVRLGVLGSLFFTVTMLVKGHFCQYCTVVHVGNLLFWIMVECSRREPGVRIVLPGLAGAVAFAAVTAVLANIDVQVKDAAAEKLEATFRRPVQ